MSASERDLRVAVGHGCFSEGGDSILSAFSWEALRAANVCNRLNLIIIPVFVRLVRISW